MVRKSARSAKSKWPCGSCGLQCNDEVILCDDCGSWYHAECECLSAKDFKVLRHLGEEYLCSSCTQTSGGQFDYTKALQRLQNASHIGMLESAVALEPPVNGLVDKTTAILHRVFHPADEDTTRREKKNLKRETKKQIKLSQQMGNLLCLGLQRRQKNPASEKE